ncbi:hypothetical protein SNE40_014523 [Patella caerulea]|uniref:NR LBD domain-containing protein n=1 Tax=Patella caerulea TaxID=87958 RepID=A0AAN8JK89_PATCE
MEVMYQPEPIYGYQHGGLHPAAFPRMFTTPRDTYSCYSFNPVRRSTHPAEKRGAFSPVPQGKTLHSVLMGEVPAAYTHLSSQRCSNQDMNANSHVQNHHSVQPVAQQTVQTEPMDLSCKKSPSVVLSSYEQHQRLSSPALSDHQGEFSMLRNLLSVGKSSHELLDSRCDTPEEDSFHKQYSGSSRVTLAKKNMLPVSARVSDWLVKVIQFAKSVPEFCNLSHNDKITLILNSWSRLLLLFMAEHNFQFAVTPLPSSPVQSVEPASPDEPSMKSVESIQTFIRKCQHLNIDSEEYGFLRLLVLFNSGYIGLDRADIVDHLNSTVQQLLQEHVRVTRPSDVMHYSHLLLCLPSLYGTNSKMLETLFCQHITRNTDMEVLLKEMLQNI